MSTEMNAHTATENTTIRFKGKIAWWWYVIVVLMFACTLAFLIQGILGITSSSSDAPVLFVGAIVFVLIDIFLIDSCVRNYVDLHNASLTIRVSALSETVSYSAISYIKETNNAWASLSTSLDRLQIRSGIHNDVLVAVKDKEAFLAEITKRNPKIRVERKRSVVDQANSTS